MWPITVGELASCLGVGAPPARRDHSLGGISWFGGDPLPDDVFFAYSVSGRDGHDEARRQLSVGAGAGVAIVGEAWLRDSGLDASLASRCLAVPSPLAAFRRLAAIMRDRMSYPVVAVGGANGKTTTKELLWACLSGAGAPIARTPGNNNGWLGVSYTLLLREHQRGAPPGAVVVEIGIDEPGAMARHVAQVRPDVCVLVTVGAEHLQGLGTTERAIDEELRLFDHPGSVRVWMMDDPELRRRATAARSGDLLVGDAALALEPRPGIRCLRYRLVERGPLLYRVHYELLADPAGAHPPLRQPGVTLSGEVDAPTLGRHNAQNTALAIGAALALGRTPTEIAAGLARYVPLGASGGGRAHLETLPSGALLLDDTYNSSPASVRAALAMLADPAFGARARVAFLGDMLDLGEHTRSLHEGLADALRAVPNVHLRLYGDAMRALFELLAHDEHDDLEAPPYQSLVHLARSAPPDLLVDRALPSLADAVVLVKGSRGMAMDRLADELRRQPPPSGAQAKNGGQTPPDR